VEARSIDQSHRSKGCHHKSVRNRIVTNNQPKSQQERKRCSKRTRKHTHTNSFLRTSLQQRTTTSTNNNHTIEIMFKNNTNATAATASHGNGKAVMVNSNSNNAIVTQHDEEANYGDLVSLLCRKGRAAPGPRPVVIGRAGDDRSFRQVSHLRQRRRG